MNDETREVALSRDQHVRELDIGASVSIADRLDTSFGISPDAISKRTRQLRGILDQSANRARKATGGEYVVENGLFFSNSGAILICVVVTRLS